MTNERPVQRSGGGIVSRSGERSNPRDIDTDDLPEVMRAWRRRWSSGVVVATTRAASGDMRGITLTALMPLSLDPPSIAFALVTDGEFLAVIRDSGRVCVQILNRDQEFLSEQFAGRAPLPNAAFGGISHEVVDELPVLADTLAWTMGDIERLEAFGDHTLVVMSVTSARINEDTDDPLLSYEGRYRGLEAS